MRLFCGIDPGVNTGVAVWDSERMCFLVVATVTIVEAMKIVKDYTDKGDVTIVTEDARKRKWLPREKSYSEFKGRAMGAGSVMRDSKIWQEFAEFYKIPIELRPPRPGMTKWNADYWAKVTGWKGRTSEHARDAALLVFQR